MCELSDISWEHRYVSVFCKIGNERMENIGFSLVVLRRVWFRPDIDGRTIFSRTRLNVRKYFLGYRPKIDSLFDSGIFDYFFFACELCLEFFVSHKLRNHYFCRTYERWYISGSVFIVVQIDGRKSSYPGDWCGMKRTLGNGNVDAEFFEVPA